MKTHLSNSSFRPVKSSALRWLDFSCTELRMLPKLNTRDQIKKTRITLSNLIVEQWMRSSQVGFSASGCQSAKVEAVHGSNPASTETMEFEERQMKQC
jgi:hypothetical protein